MPNLVTYYLKIANLIISHSHKLRKIYLLTTKLFLVLIFLITHNIFKRIMLYSLHYKKFHIYYIYCMLLACFGPTLTIDILFLLIYTTSFSNYNAKQLLRFRV